MKVTSEELIKVIRSFGNIEWEIQQSHMKREWKYIESPDEWARIALGDGTISIRAKFTPEDLVLARSLTMRNGSADDEIAIMQEIDG